MIEMLSPLTYYDFKHMMLSMDINQFRQDLLAAVEASGKTVHAIARQTGVQHASLFRFLKGDTGLNANTMLALYPFVYGDKRPPAKVDPPTPNEVRS